MINTIFHDMKVVVYLAQWRRCYQSILRTYNQQPKTCDVAWTCQPSSPGTHSGGRSEVETGSGLSVSIKLSSSQVTFRVNCCFFVRFLLN